MTEIEKAIKIITEFQSKHGKPITEYEVTQEQLDKLRSEASYVCTSPADHQLENTIMGVRIKVVPSENEQRRQQLASYKNLTTAQEKQLSALRNRLYELRGADKTLDSEREANALLTEQLATAQAENLRLREALEDYFKQYPHMMKGYILDALAIRSDNSALKAIVQRAGEVMRERCASSFNQPHVEWFGDSIQLTIRALPGVTLEDLK